MTDLRTNNEIRKTVDNRKSFLFSVTLKVHASAQGAILSADWTILPYPLFCPLLKLKNFMKPIIFRRFGSTIYFPVFVKLSEQHNFYLEPGNPKQGSHGTLSTRLESGFMNVCYRRRGQRSEATGYSERNFTNKCRSGLALKNREIKENTRRRKKIRISR